MRIFKNKLTTMQKEAIAKTTVIKDLSYPAKDDIYNKCKLENLIDPASIHDSKEINTNVQFRQSKMSKGEFSNDEFDVPGSELDDLNEAIGSEDEENNYYSLGLDNHNEIDDNNE